MTTEMIERDIALRVAVGDPEPVSVEDAAALVAEIRRLREDRKTLSATATRLGAEWNAITKERDQLVAENAVLHAAEARVRELCRKNTEIEDGSAVNAYPLWPTEILDALDGEA